MKNWELEVWREEWQRRNRAQHAAQEHAAVRGLLNRARARRGSR